LQFGFKDQMQTDWFSYLKSVR